MKPMGCMKRLHHLAPGRHLLFQLRRRPGRSRPLPMLAARADGAERGPTQPAALRICAGWRPLGEPRSRPARSTRPENRRPNDLPGLGLPAYDRARPMAARGLPRRRTARSAVCDDAKRGTSPGRIVASATVQRRLSQRVPGRGFRHAAQSLSAAAWPRPVNIDSWRPLLRA